MTAGRCECCGVVGAIPDDECASELDGGDKFDTPWRCLACRRCGVAVEPVSQHPRRVENMKALVSKTEREIRSRKGNYVSLDFLDNLALLLTEAPEQVNGDEQLRTFIERLPKGADGVILRPGMRLWNALFFEVEVESIVWGNYHEHPAHAGQECCDLVNRPDGTSINAFCKQCDRFRWWKCYTDWDAAIKANEMLQAELDELENGGSKQPIQQDLHTDRGVPVKLSEGLRGASNDAGGDA